ncbi:MAG TPA: alpha/beta hydrolase [Candidatus Acidoferrales bacterium]
MRRLLQHALFALLVVTALGAGCTSGPQEALARRFPAWLKPCKLEPAGVAVLCGSFEVPENRSAPEGRKLSLRVAVLRAYDRPQPDPVFVIAGGPGESAVNLASALGADTLAEAGRDRDIVFIDQRGTGQSNPFHCDLFGERNPVEQLARLDFFPAEALKQCLANFPGDPRMYTTRHALADLEEIRAAIGYPLIFLDGASYGSRAALEYIRGYGQRVGAAVITSSSPTHREAMEASAGAAERALRGVFADCSARPECAKEFPDPERELREVLRRLRAAPAVAGVRPREDAPEVRIRVTPELFQTCLRMMLYSAETSAQIPAVIRHAHRGDFQPALRGLAPMAFLMRRGLSTGMFLTVWCNEFAPMQRAEDFDRQQDGLLGADTLVESAFRACAAWPREETASAPVKSDVPVLLFSGERDPATPAEASREMARHLERSRHIVVRGAGHQIGHDACRARIIAYFFRNPAGAAPLDTSCLPQP